MPNKRRSLAALSLILAATFGAQFALAIAGPKLAPQVQEALSGMPAPDAPDIALCALDKLSERIPHD